MNAKKIQLYGLMAEFTDHDQIVTAAKRAHEHGYRCMDASTPFQVEDLPAALGHKRTPMPRIVLVGGILGACGGYFLRWYATVVDYPLNIGGRPLHSWPAFVPITFEFTVLCAALFAFIGMLALNRLPRPHHPVFNVPEFERASTDRFFFCIEARDAKFDPAGIHGEPQAGIGEGSGAMKFQTPNTKLQRTTKSQVPRSWWRGCAFRGLKFGVSLVFGVWCLLLSSGCRRDMFDQPRSKPLAASDFFPDGAASRPLPPNTVARGYLHDDEAFYRGAIGTNLVIEFPFPITREILRRGQERFEVHCAACHGRSGDGMIVHRGFPAPPSYHTERLRAAPVGHFYDVMTRGFGVMYSQASRVPPNDR